MKMYLRHKLTKVSIEKQTDMIVKMKLQEQKENMENICL